MIETIVVVLGMGLAYWIGYRIGGNVTRREIFKALGAKPGYRITGVSYEKARK
jgi:membrane protein DedA with SNARE-associated domain